MLPLMFLSSAFIQPGFLPGWMQAIAAAQPPQLGGRRSAATALSADPDWAAVAARGGGLLVLAVIAIALSVRTFRNYARNVDPPRPETARMAGTASSGTSHPPCSPQWRPASVT